MIRWRTGIAAALLTAGCASMHGSNLVPNKSTASDVQAQMGTPVERQTIPGGGSVWWYPHGPSGFHSYAVVLGADNVVRSVEQRLTVENVKRVRAAEWTRKEVRELFGPPFLVSTLPRMQREVWEYQILDVAFKWKLWIQFSADGVVREVLQMRHPDMDPPGSGDRD
jgi:hypothetical protein